MKKVVSLMLALTIFFAGCSSQTLINSSPSGAKVIVDGNLIGTTPVTYGDTAISGSSKTVILKKDGYEDKTAIIRKEEVKIGPIIGGVFLLFPFIWTLGYPDAYTFELSPVTDQ